MSNDLASTAPADHGRRLGKAMKGSYGVERVAFRFTGTDVQDGAAGQ